MTGTVVPFRRYLRKTSAGSCEYIGPYMLMQAGGLGILRIVDGLSREEINAALGKINHAFAFLACLPKPYKVEMGSGLSRYCRGLPPDSRDLIGIGLIFWRTEG